IIILVLAPLFVLTGVEGQLLRPLAIAYVVAMVASLATAMTVTPVLCFWLGGRAAREAPLARLCKGWLDRSLPWGLAHPRAVAGGAALAVVAAGGLLAVAPRPLVAPVH